MSPRRVLLQALWLLGLAAYAAAVVLEPREAVGVLLAGALAFANFWLTGRRLRVAADLVRMVDEPNPRALTAGTLTSAGIRWLVTFFLLWALLERYAALPVVAGLGCVVAAIALQALLAYARGVRASDGAEP